MTTVQPHFQNQQRVFIIPSKEIGETNTQFQVAYFDRYRTGRYEGFANVILMKSGASCVVHLSELIPINKRESWHQDSPANQLVVLTNSLAGDVSNLEDKTASSTSSIFNVAKRCEEYAKEIQELLPFITEPRLW